MCKSKKLFCLLTLILVIILTGCESRTKEQILHDGLQFSQAGNYRGAIVFFKKALEKDPNFFEARYQLADAYLRLGEFDKAGKEFNKVALQAPGYRHLPLKLAEIFLSTNRVEKALEKLRAYLEKHPKDGQAWDLLGRVYAVKKDHSAARKAFRKAILFSPGSLIPTLHLAQLLTRLKEYDSARRLLEEIVAGDKKNGREILPAYYMLASLEWSQGNVDKAISIYHKIREKHPDEIRAAYFETLLLLDKKDLPAAEKIITDLLKRAADRPEGYRLKGMLLYAKKDFPGAEVELLHAIKLDGGHPFSSYFLGLTYYQLDKLELALSQFQKALDHAPAFDQARIMVAMVLLKQKRLDDAANEIQKVLKKDSRNARAHNILGSIYLAQNRYDEAMAEFDRAIAIDPNLADAHLKKGLFSMMKGDPRKTEDELTKALSITPEVLNTRMLLSAFYVRQQNYKEALETMREGLTGKPRDALLYNYMAAVLMKQKRIDEALDTLRQAKKINPGYATPYFNIAAYYLSKNEYDKAIAEYDELLKTDPGNVRALLAIASTYELKGDEEKAGEYFVRASQTDDPRGYMALSRYYRRIGRIAEASGPLDLGLEKHPNDPMLLEMKGRLLVEKGSLENAAPILKDLEKVSPGRGIPLLVRAYLGKGEVGKAVHLAEKLISDHPDRGYGYILLGDIYRTTRDYRKAEKILKQGLEKVADQQKLPLLVNLGRVYEAQKDFPAARRCYRRAADEFPESSLPVSSLASLDDRLGNKKQALDLYLEGLTKNKNDLTSLNNLACLYADNYSEKKKALKLAMRAYRLAPNRPEVIDTLGYTLWLNGRYEEALKLLEKAARLLNKNPSVKYHLALACKSLGREERALSLLKEASVEKTPFPERQAVTRLLAELEKSPTAK